MSLLLIGALNVRVSEGTAYQVDAFGEFGRSWAGRMRSNYRAHHRVFRVTTPVLPTADMETLRAALLAPWPLTVSGAWIGADSTFHPRGIQIQPVTGNEWVVTFELHETVESVEFAFAEWWFRDVDGTLVMTNVLADATHFLAYDPVEGEFFVVDDRSESNATMRYVRGEARLFYA